MPSAYLWIPNVSAQIMSAPLIILSPIPKYGFVMSNGRLYWMDHTLETLESWASQSKHNNITMHQLHHNTTIKQHNNITIQQHSKTTTSQYNDNNNNKTSSHCNNNNNTTTSQYNNNATKNPFAERAKSFVNVLRRRWKPIEEINFWTQEEKYFDFLCLCLS